MEKIKNIINILFKFSTENHDGRSNRNILVCLKKVSEFLKREGVYNEIQTYSIESQNNKTKHANLVAFNPKTTGPYILFQGHMDTVPTFSDFKTTITSRKVQGRGAVDMKGSLVGIINAFIALYKKYPVMLLITGDEEANGFAGIKNFIKNDKKKIKNILFAINGEPSNFVIHKNFRGVLGYRLQIKGKEGHSAYSNKESLIEEMVPVINAINKFIKKARNVKDKKLGKTIGAFTVLKSGMKENQLPKDFKASWNLRTVKSKKVYMELFQKTVKPFISSKIKIETFSFDPVSANIPIEYLKNLKTSFSKSGIKYRESPARFFTEATLMNKIGIPSIVCGPGNPRLAHAEPQREIITIKKIKNYSKLLKNIVYEFNK
jgi:acetylornithine deacetylase